MIALAAGGRYSGLHGQTLAVAAADLRIHNKAIAAVYPEERHSLSFSIDGEQT
jgi:ribosomal protein L25 (general stress protein Ctc)